MSQCAPFSLIPKDILTGAGIALLFIRWSGVVVPGPVGGPSEWPDMLFGGIPDSVKALWCFLEAHPHVMVVLMPDENYPIESLRTRKLRPSLGTRVIGAAGFTPTDPMISIHSWLGMFAGELPWAVIDNRIEQYFDKRRLVPVFYETGLSTMDINQAAQHLRISSELLHHEGWSDGDLLGLAAALYLEGQEDLSRIAYQGLCERKGVENKISSYDENGASSNSLKTFLSSRDLCAEKFYRMASLLGVRLRVVTEPADK